MFWKQQKAPPIRSLIGEGTVLRGSVQFHDGLRVDGEVFGDITPAGDDNSIVVISVKARVHGRVKARHVIIGGEVLGPIDSDGLVELQPTARVVGDIRYEALEVHPGATIEGELRSLKSADKPALVLAASNRG
jgi:cytoskeletal protein CcmA (bactofilin family)